MVSASLQRPPVTPSPPRAGCSSWVDGKGKGGQGNNEEEGGYNSEDEYSHLGLHLTEEEWQEKDRRFEKMMRKKGMKFIAY